MKRRLYSLLAFFLLLSFVSCANRTPIEVDVDSQWLPGLNEITSELNDYQIYLIGETHGVAATYSAEIELIKYFNQIHGVQDVLLEEGYGSSMLFQDYLNTGDTAKLVKYIEASQGSAAYTIEHYDFCIELYEFNMTLPEDERIRVFGVDVEHQYELSLWYLEHNISMEQRDDLLNQLFSTNDAAEIIELIDMILSIRDIYQEQLKGFADKFLLTLDGMLQGQIYYSISDMDSQTRENYFTGNALSALERIGNKKVLALFGSAHVDLSKETSTNYQLVGVGIEKEYGKDKVTSLGFVYNNSMYRTSNNCQKAADTMHGNILSMQTKLEVCVFPLSIKDTNKHISRFAESYHYAILIQNSNAATQYGGQRYINQGD